MKPLRGSKALALEKSCLMPSFQSAQHMESKPCLGPGKKSTTLWLNLALGQVLGAPAKLALSVLGTLVATSALGLLMVKMAIRHKHSGF